MIRFFISLFLVSFLSHSMTAQNLIPDPSAEDYYQCPNSLGPVDSFLSQWIAYRGTSDYFHSCCQQPGLCWYNSLGFQEPHSGNGYIGAVTFHTSLENAREYFGIELVEPMQIGGTYYVSFHVSMAYKDGSPASQASNNIGFLLMTNNYLAQEEQAYVPNFAHYKIDTLHNDTTNWVQISTSITADSAYSEIAFGNFYSDEFTQHVAPFIPDDSGSAYYYFDDFCVSQDSVLCEFILNTSQNGSKEVKVFPNPSKGQFSFESHQKFQRLKIYNTTGKLVWESSLGNSETGIIHPKLNPGFYIIKFINGKRTINKRIMVQ